MRTPVIAGNWKMYKTPREAALFCNGFLPRCAPGHAATIALFPPAITLPALLQALGERADIMLGVQNIHAKNEGAFTGEISAPMAADAGARIVLAGHSERRHIFGETDEDVAAKVAAALAAGLDVVACVGEKLEERRAGRVEEVILRQLRAVLGSVQPDQLARLAIAYEPVWAIGTGVNATPADASSAHASLRAELRTRYGAAADDVPILYGGSVKPDNARALLEADEVDGLLIGGASLDPVGFASICDIASTG